MDDRRVVRLAGGRAVLVENGPMRLVIQAYSGNQARVELAEAVAGFAFTCLARVAAAQPMLRRPHGEIATVLNDRLAAMMLASVRRVGAADLTPMAAVAGTIADFVADRLFLPGVTRVIVDNGGDIAIRLREHEVVRVGIRPEVGSPGVSHTLRLDGRHSTWGVNTSGLGGRSLTRGIASAVTAVAANSSLADAAATALANACFAPDPAICQVPAATIDPASDLGDLPVTIRAAGLLPATIDQALANGLQLAARLQEQGTIRGAVLAVAGKIALTPGFSEAVGEISRYDGQNRWLGGGGDGDI